MLADIVSELKEKEYEGYQYEGADSSFELIIRKRVEGVEPFFDLISYKVLDELPYDNNHSATATIKIRVGSKVKIAASDGDGPVNALDKALREALAEFYPCLNEVRLIDYKVRVMEPKDATAARVRVLISSADGSDIWTTVGVSQDIIEASWTALVDSIEHKLCKQPQQNNPPF
ncbi:MAG: alpha-isopropylmalate synthase regulatory domain-containing protein [Acutalibacteraceae bacterium]